MCQPLCEELGSNTHGTADVAERILSGTLEALLRGHMAGHVDPRARWSIPRHASCNPDLQLKKPNLCSKLKNNDTLPKSGLFTKEFNLKFRSDSSQEHACAIQRDIRLV